MKLLKTIEKLIKEAEDRYDYACENGAPLDEIDKLEDNYKQSLKLLKIYKSNKDNTKDN
jgi:hypothetical protein